MSRINDAWQMYIYYGLLIGAGLSIPIPIMSTISRWFVKRRTTMTGVLMLGSGVSGIFMPPVANWLISNHGWRFSFMVLGSILVVIMAVAAQFLKRDPSQINQAPDGAREGTGDKSRANTVGLMLKEALITHQFWLLFVIFFCLMVHLVPHITDLRISATIAATVLTASNAAGIVGRIGLGGLGDRLGNKRLFVITFILLAVTFGGLMFIREVWLFYLSVIIFGLGYGAGLTQESPIIAHMFGLRSHGLILGVSSLGHTMGAAVGTFLAGYFFDISGSYQLTFIICGAASIIGLGLVLVLTPVKSRVA
jgi:MFS family permease